MILIETESKKEHPTVVLEERTTTSRRDLGHVVSIGEVCHNGRIIHLFSKRESCPSGQES